MIYSTKKKRLLRIDKSFEIITIFVTMSQRELRLYTL